MRRKFENLMRAMELEQSVDTSDRPHLELICENAPDDLSGPVIPPYERVVDPETGHVTYNKKTTEETQQDYS